jgi:chromosome segregation ATPase
MKDIKTLAEARERIETLEAQVKTEQEALATETTAHAETQSKLEAADTKATEAEARASKAESDLAVEQAAHEAIKTANAKVVQDNEATATLLAEIGIKPDASVTDNQTALRTHCDRVASAKALQITAAQGSDTPLPATGEQAGASSSSQADENLSPMARIAKAARVAK